MDLPSLDAGAIDLEDQRVTVQWLTAFLDSPRDSGAPAFWTAVTATTLSPPRGARGEFATLVPRRGDAYLRVQDVGAAVAGCHLDLHVGDVDEALAGAVAAGASVVAEPGGYAVLRSPGGFAFCLVPDHGESTRPRPEVWPGGWASLVDQICLDIPAPCFDEDATFWARLTGWARRGGALSEFEYLTRPSGMPLRILLQRLGPDDERRSVSGHLDFACDDVANEVARQLDLGAVVVTTFPLWVTLRDPAGRCYCVTSRDPSTGTLPG